MRLSHLFVALIVCFAWGLNAVAAKVGVTFIPPVFFTGLRFIFVLMCLVPWLKPARGRWQVLIPAVAGALVGRFSVSVNRPSGTHITVARNVYQ